MWIFKYYVNSFCDRILEAYQLAADKKSYEGKEAELLIKRNEQAKLLIEDIKKIPVNTEQDFEAFFQQVSQLIHKYRNETEMMVKEYNTNNNTNYTLDIYQSFFIEKLHKFVSNTIFNLFSNSHKEIQGLMDDSLLSPDNTEAPCLYRMTSVFYGYVLDKEFEFILTDSTRDIFDDKKSLVINYMNDAAKLSQSTSSEDSRSTQETILKLLQGMRSEEHDIQQRREKEESKESNMLSIFRINLYKASEKIWGKSQLGQKIELLINELSSKLSCDENVHMNKTDARL